MPAVSAPLPSFASARTGTATNSAVAITLPAITSVKHVLRSIVWSYNGDPTGGRITVEDGSGSTVLSFDITVGGPGVVNLGDGVAGSAGTALIVTLAAGGTGVAGRLTVNASKL